MPEFIGAIDQGTTSTRFFVFDKKSNIIGMDQVEHKQIYPMAGWVEHDPLEIKDNVFKVMQGALIKAKLEPRDLMGIGITNQRETTVIWNRNTGRPYYNAIVWQDTRTGGIIDEIAVDDNIDCYRKTTGLPLATYFSGPKIKWIMDHVEGIRESAAKGDALFGNIDTWITWWLTGGPGGGIHITDVTNAGRTLLMDLKSLDWDDQMLRVLDIPRAMLPAIKSSSEIYGYTSKDSCLKHEIPVAGILGDQQAALFGQVCFDVGDVKTTYGTGAFLLLNTGHSIIHSRCGLITTVGYQIGKEKPVYALEGSVAVAGSLVQWLRDNLGMIDQSADIEKLAASVENSGGIYFVPAFSGLFAPYWRTDARGVLIGLTQYINKGHIARAVLEATAFQTAEIIKPMEQDMGIKIPSLKVDGGMVVNDLLMQFQADILGIKVIRPEVIETTVLGAAYAAGLGVGFWKTPEELKHHWTSRQEWEPGISAEQRDKSLAGWKKAVERSFELA